MHLPQTGERLVMDKIKAQVWLDKLHDLTDLIETLREQIFDSEKELNFVKEQTKSFEKKLWEYKKEWAEYLVKEAELKQEQT